MLPKYIYRKHDGWRFTLQKDGKYTMDKRAPGPTAHYFYSAFAGSSFVENINDIIIVEYKGKNDGHGNEYYE